MATPPTATAAAARFVTACVEVLNGYRPVSHVRALTHPLEAATVLAEMTAASRRLRQAAGPGALLRVRTIRTCEPRPGVAEIAVVLAAEPADRGHTLPRPRRTAGDRPAAVPRVCAVAAGSPVLAGGRERVVAQPGRGGVGGAVRTAGPVTRPGPQAHAAPAGPLRRAGAIPVKPVRRSRAAARRPAAPSAWALAYRLEHRHERWLCTAARLL